MGIIQKQALRTTIVSFAGIGIGIVSQLIMAIILTKEEIGTLSLINSISNFIAVIFCLGFAQITYQIFAHFRNEKNGHSGYIVFTLFFTIIGILLGEITFYFSQNLFVGTGTEQQLIRSLAYLIFPLIFFRIFFRNFDVYMRMLFSSVTGVVLEGIVLRIVIFIGVIIFWLGIINYEGLAYVYTAALALPGLIILILSLVKTNKIKFPEKETFTPEIKKKSINYGMYGILYAVSGIIVLSVDQLMLNQMVNTEAVGVYSVIFFAAALIAVPSRGVRRIAVPVLTEAWKNNDLKSITAIYNKSAINMAVIGFFLFILGWACIEPALTFIPKYSEGLFVFLFLALTQLFEMMSGVNMEIILTSKKYRVNTYFTIALGVLVVVFNYFFIKEWGINGAAAASALAMLLVNAARWFYLKKVYGLQPFTPAFFKVFIIGGSLFLLITFIELPFSPLVQLIFYPISLTLIFWTLVIRLKLSSDINNWIKKIKMKFIG